MATTTQTAALPVRKPSLRERLDLGSGVFPYFLVAPTIIVIALVAVYPILDSIRLSLLDNPLIPACASFVGFRNYFQIIGDPALLSCIVMSNSFSVVSVVLVTLVGFALAFLMD